MSSSGEQFRAGVMYGLTHDANTGLPVVRVPRTVKVGIGLPKGPAIHAWIGAKGEWKVSVGSGKEAAAKAFAGMEEARAYYRDAVKRAPERPYPARLPHFIFTRINSAGIMEPDWEVTAQHGPIPTEIDIVFVTDAPLAASYQMWTASELKCEGDGLNARRVLSLAQGDAETQAAAVAHAAGERYFPIVRGCWTCDCPFSKPMERNGKTRPSPCKPHGRLQFQLLSSPRLGGTAYFDTTGFRSISQLFSCLEVFKTVTGRGNPAAGYVAGIPLKLLLRPYRAAHQGKASMQYGVALEFRAETAAQLKAKLIEYGLQFRQIGQAPLALMAGEVIPEALEPEANERDGTGVETEAMTAAALAGEFYPDEQPPEGSECFEDPEAPARPALPRMPQRKSAVPPGRPVIAAPTPEFRQVIAAAARESGANAQDRPPEKAPMHGPCPKCGNPGAAEAPIKVKKQDGGLRLECANCNWVWTEEVK